MKGKETTMAYIVAESYQRMEQIGEPFDRNG
jgi:hypothetical protein